MQTSQLAENDNFADIFGLQALVLVTADDKQLVLSSCFEQMTPHWDGTRQLGGADDADDNQHADDDVLTMMMLTMLIMKMLTMLIMKMLMIPQLTQMIGRLYL